MVLFISQAITLAFLFGMNAVSAGTPQVCSNPQLSCKTSAAASCCFNSPGGQLVQTQFWDYSPSTGPSDSWTIHGLWPDHCDGTYDANCDSSRTHSDIRDILQSFGKTDLLNYMNIYWKDYQGNDDSFWSHEWDKHGTCVNTLEPSCYDDYTPNQEVVDYFQKAVDLFQGLDTYNILASAGIVPSNTATYTSAQVQAAIQKAFGFQATIGCSSGALNEIWYSFEVQGSAATGTYVATGPDGTKSTCPASGIKYLPKSGSPAPPPLPTTTDAPTLPTTDSAGPISTGTGVVGTLSGTGYLVATTGGSQTGCLISQGVWITGGTCATYTATPSGSGFTLMSSRGACGISNSAFSCGSGVSATQFTTMDGYLAVDGNAQFYTSDIPTGQVHEVVSTSPDSVSVSFSWQAR